MSKVMLLAIIASMTASGLLQAAERNDGAGQVQVVRIAEGAPNRIVTPYPSPKLITNVEHEAWSAGNVLYVLPMGDQRAIGGFVQDETGEFAVAVMLEVARIPPQEIRLTDPSYEPVTPGGTDAPNGGEGQSHVDEVVDTLIKALNQEQIPGFRQLAAAGHQVYVGPLRMELEHAQQRGDLIVERHRITNDGESTRGISEASFHKPGRMGVMVFPPISEIAPGQEAQVFILRRVSRG